MQIVQNLVSVHLVVMTKVSTRQIKFGSQKINLNLRMYSVIQTLKALI